MFTLEVEVPHFAIKIQNEPAALQSAASQLATAMQQRIDAGLSSSGLPLPAAHDKDRGPVPLERTGALRSSIEGRVENGAAIAGPTGDRAKVAAILASPGRKTHRPARDVFTPTDADEAAATDAYERLIELELDEA